LRFTVFAAVCQRIVLAVVFLTGGTIPMTAAGIGAFTGLIDLVSHNFYTPSILF
jgi:hypothetical protein